MNVYRRIEEMAEARVRQVAENMAEMLVSEADQLERWIVESQTGGWSTHQVDAMRKRAAYIRETLVKMGF